MTQESKPSRPGAYSLLGDDLLDTEREPALHREEADDGKKRGAAAKDTRKALGAIGITKIRVRRGVGDEADADLAELPAAEGDGTYKFLPRRPRSSR